MPTPELEEAVKYSLAGFTGMGLVTWLARFLMKSYRTERLANTVTGAEIGSYERIVKEVKWLRRKCEDLEYRIKMVAEVELEGATDVGMLTAYIQNMPCGKCGAPDDTFSHIEEILARMVERRKIKMTLLNTRAKEDDDE